MELEDKKFRLPLSRTKSTGWVRDDIKLASCWKIIFRVEATVASPNWKHGPPRLVQLEAVGRQRRQGSGLGRVTMTRRRKKWLGTELEDALTLFWLGPGPRTQTQLGLKIVAPPWGYGILLWAQLPSQRSFRHTIHAISGRKCTIKNSQSAGHTIATFLRGTSDNLQPGINPRSWFSSSARVQE